MRPHPALAVGLAAALILASCKSPSDDEGGDGTSATTTAPERTASERATGVTDDAITIGIPYLDLSSLEGVIDISHGDYVAAYTAVIDDLNASGGVAGRRIEPVFAPVPPSQLDPDGAQNACTTLTEDEEVFAVLGFVDGDGALCYVEQHDTPLVGGYMNPDRLSRATAPWFATVVADDHRVREGITALADDLADATVAVVGNPADTSTVDDVAVTALEEAGIDVVDTAVFDASGGDIEAARSQATTLSERFESEGVDTILALGSSDVLMVEGLTRSGFRPDLVSFTTDGINGLIADGTIEESILDTVTAITEIPPRPTEDPAFANCIDVIEEATGTTIEDPDTKPLDGDDTWVSARLACQQVGLFAAIAEGAGDQLTNATFLDAGDDLGSIDLPGLPGADYSAERPDGALPLYRATYDPDAERMIADPEPIS